MLDLPKTQETLLIFNAYGNVIKANAVRKNAWGRLFVGLSHPVADEYKVVQAAG